MIVEQNCLRYMNEQNQIGNSSRFDVYTALKNHCMFPIDNLNPINYQSYIPTRIRFGVGEFSNIKNMKLPGGKALIVISSGNSMMKHGYLSKLEEQLDYQCINYVVYDKVQSNPTVSNVMEAKQRLKENQCDFVIGLGGGSCIDAAKAIAFLATNEGDLWDYFQANTERNLDKACNWNNPLPIVTITTTAGTGSEANPCMVISNTETKEKMGFSTENTFPHTSIIDPMLTVSIPKRLTALQGFDALFHSVEGYMNKKASELSDTFALDSIFLLSNSLEEAVHRGSNVEHRARVSLASTLAGFVQTISDCISQHAIEHAMSGLHPELEHGAGLIMISKAYFSHFAKQESCREKMITLARVLGKKDATEPMEFVEVLDNLMKKCEVDCITMSQYHIQREEFPKIAELATSVGKRLFLGDPVDLNKDDIIHILEQSYC